VRRIAEIGNLIAHARRQGEAAAVLQLRFQFALQHIEDMAAVAPMIRQIAGAVFHHPDADSSIFSAAAGCAVSPACSTAGILDQSVTEKARSVIFMSTLSAGFRTVAAAMAFPGHASAAAARAAWS